MIILGTAFYVLITCKLALCPSSDGLSLSTMDFRTRFCLSSVLGNLSTDIVQTIISIFIKHNQHNFHHTSPDLKNYFSPPLVSCIRICLYEVPASVLSFSAQKIKIKIISLCPIWRSSWPLKNMLVGLSRFSHLTLLSGSSRKKEHFIQFLMHVLFGLFSNRCHIWSISF